ncbi:MAG: hypothetical protein JST39_01350, partial [Bacteroidetes bacterium]|nr:hypothetical protein [Bacteroidota bacterium]
MKQSLSIILAAFTLFCVGSTPKYYSYYRWQVEENEGGIPLRGKPKEVTTTIHHKDMLLEHGLGAGNVFTCRFDDEGRVIYRKTCNGSLAIYERIYSYTGQGLQVELKLFGDSSHNPNAGAVK